MAEKGYKVSGVNPESGLVEIMELEKHPYFIATQAHPEFKSRISAPAPLFDGLIKAAFDKYNNK
jgi:CTP synthase